MRRKSLFNPFYISHSEMSKVVSSFAIDYKGNMLDIGCGQKPYLNLFDNIVDYVGLEVEPDEYREKNKTADFYYDGVTLPFDNNSFDNIVCFQVLEHVEDYQSFLNEIVRVLKPRGNLMLSLPFIWPEHEMPYDFRRFNVNGLELELKKCNFEIVKTIKVTKGFRAYLQLIQDYVFHANAPKALRYSVIFFLNLFSSLSSNSNVDHRFYLDVLTIARIK